MKRGICRILLICVGICIATHARAAEPEPAQRSLDELLYTPVSNTECATKAFADALAATANTVDESMPESEIQQWIYSTFATPSVLEQVLACPELEQADPTEPIRFMPIEYTFPNGRKIVANYETVPQVLEQRVRLGNKRGLPSTDPSPRLGAADDGTIWTNTDPAWYGIMVVQHGALSNFAGPGKNNTISMKYIADNIDSLYPKGWYCTSKSAIANDRDEINKAVTKTVGLPEGEDTNDYYVAGDVSLEWISYAEIALDIAITVATFGGGAVILGATKAVRASKALKTAQATLKTLRGTESVTKYIKLSKQQAKITRNITKLSETQAKLAKEVKQLDKVADAAKIADHEREIERIGKEIKTSEKNLSELEKTIKDLEKADKKGEIKQYKETSSSVADLQKYRTELHAMRHPKRGNIGSRLARSFRVIKAANKGGGTISKAAKLGRTGPFVGQARDWLFHSTLRNIGMLGRLEETGGILYGVVSAVGDFYDYTETSTGEFTNGIEFKPLLLLSADDIPGQDNVVNYGMWLMWAGDSLEMADDDAAYLQAMDFAEKVWQDLVTHQEEAGTHYCDIDIYVVRPIIRNPGENDGELYYLIMNDEPWTTVD